ncbi:hypothetical protein PRIPAC_77978 [Pristionchus pacificus]|uniref:Uncharacterized protein n=1 Tax=Pristionchus pacificus TaxID=54126 RepID=A0A2A6BX29_PRIPA|nr:hypothetical protein PRIPAC_77978 [Pristionchus pacificus]|eukprot:PDM70321.1 hypothetical protein PRIPAC_46567 [Pristionchus pacificus]
MRLPLQIARRFKFAVVDDSEALARRTVAAAKNYTIRPLTAADFPALMDLGEGFVEEDSLLKAVKATFPLYRRSLEHVFEQAIRSQDIVDTSLMVTHKETGRPVGYRLYYPVWRDELRHRPWPKHALNMEERSAQSMQKLFYDKFWELYPDETVTFRGETVYVARAHRQHGLFPVLYEYGLRYDDIVEELNLSSMTVMYEGPKAVRCADGTEVRLPDGPISLMSREMEGALACDVKPHWERMGLI